MHKMVNVIRKGKLLPSKGDYVRVH